MNGATTCQGCGASVPDVVETRARPYVGSAPGCWLFYTEVLAREYGDFRYTPAHQLTVDTYAVQHPGLPERRTAQSVAIHLVGLCLSLERGRGPHGVATPASAHGVTEARLPVAEAAGIAGGAHDRRRS